MKASAFFAFLLIPVTLLGFASGFVGEMFMIGYRAGQGSVTILAALAQQKQKEGRNV